MRWKVVKKHIETSDEVRMAELGYNVFSGVARNCFFSSLRGGNSANLSKILIKIKLSVEICKPQGGHGPCQPPCYATERVAREDVT
jgi:hypothetical protein